MKPHQPFSVIIVLLATTWVSPARAQGNAPPSYEEARKASWTLTNILIEPLEQGEAKQWPGTQAWIKDLRAQTKGVDKDTPIAKWPKADVGALVDHNPNFWRMYFEIAPADPTVAIIHASLLLSQGEPKRAEYILDLGKHRPGIPKQIAQGLQMLQNTTRAALMASDALTDEGTKLFDKGDYDGAIKKYREAHTLCPNNAWTYYEMGYTVRTKVQVARGEPLQKEGTIKINGTSHDTPAIIGAFAEARRHDPLMFRAYQGSDQNVIKGLTALVKKVLPAYEALHKQGLTKADEYHALESMSEGLSEAGVHDLAIFARQLMVARRNSYDPTDYPIFVVALRKLAPGPVIEEILAKLAGKNAIGFRSLTKLESEDGQPSLGSGERLTVPDGPMPKPDPNQPVNVDFIRLLLDPDEIAKRTTVEDLAKFHKDFKKIAEESLGKCEKPCKVLVQFTCAPSGHTVDIMHQPKDIDEKPLKEMHAAIAKLDKLPVKEKTVEFQVQLSVTPKSKLPHQPASAR